MTSKVLVQKQWIVHRRLAGLAVSFLQNVLDQIRSDVASSYFVKQNMHRHPTWPSKSRKEQ